MEPITREEYYLAKIAGTWEGNTPEPVTIEEYYLATMAGDYSGNTPQPVTRLQYYMAKAAGVWGGSIPAPVTRLEYYWAAIAGKEGHIPDPVTRQEYLLYAISQSNNDVINTVSGSTIIITDAAEGRPFRGLRVFGRSTQVQTTGAQLINTQGAGNSRGVDWVFDKGVVTFSGVTVDTSTNRVNCAVNVKDVMEIGKTYFAKSFTVGIASDVAVEKPSGVIYTREYTPDGTETGICIRALVDKSNDAGIEIDLTAYVAITENERLSSWEPYTGGKPSPSPEYPQEIVSAGESGTINVSISDSRSQSQSLTLATPNGLPGVPVSKDGNYTDADGQQWICDEIDLGRGKYIQRVAEKDIYESQNTWGGQGIWGNNDNYNTLGFYLFIDGSNGGNNWGRLPLYNGMCNYFGLTGNVYQTSIIGFTMGNYIAFRVPRALLPDWDESNPSNDPWVNWLKARKEAGNPVIVRYALATPIERDLTPEEIAAYKALHTNYPTTVISNDAGAHMEVAYVVER